MVYIGKQPSRVDADYVRASVDETITGEWTFMQDIIGTAISTKYADIAERYEADKEYPHGTIISFGGEKEVTAAKQGDKIILGVISTDPAIKLNNEAGTDKTHPYIGLLGRVPCRVVGKINKFSFIVMSHIIGVGKEMEDINTETKVGISLQDKDTEDEGIINIFLD